MGLNLRIENEARLADGGPLTFAMTGNRGADIGRDAHLDWTLPDPSRHVSGKHCEIRFQDGGYWLKDVSRNGTFLNGSEQRVQSPYRLRSGDRLLIGPYIVAVEVTSEAALAAPRNVAPQIAADPEDLWGGAIDPAAPLDPRELRPSAQLVPVRADFLEWAVDVPNSPGSGFVARPAGIQPAAPVETAEALSWDSGVMPSPAPPEPPAPVPTPRRSIWVGPGPDGPWSGDAEASATPPAPVRASAPLAAPPMPAPIPAAAPPVRPMGGAPGGQSDVLGRFAQGAGLPAEALAGRDAGDFAEWIGRLMLLVTDNVKQLLDARGQTKRITRSSHQTMIAALDNNPLKFSPSAADAVRIMLGPPTRSYLAADQAFQQGFDDVKSHQVKTFAAMQRALTMLLDDMDPKSIENGLAASKGIAGWGASRGARLWSLYETRWQAKTSRQGEGMQDLFMRYFAECYDQASGPPGETGGSR